MRVKDFIKQLKALSPDLSVNYTLVLTNEKTKSKMIMTNDIPKDEPQREEQKNIVIKGFSE